MPYMGKHLQGKAFMVFHSTANVFMRIMVLSISNISLQKCYSKSFTTNSQVFSTQNVKVFPHECFSIYGIWTTNSIVLAHKFINQSKPQPIMQGKIHLLIQNLAILFAHIIIALSFHHHRHNHHLHQHGHHLYKQLAMHLYYNI